MNHSILCCPSNREEGYIVVILFFGTTGVEYWYNEKLWRENQLVNWWFCRNI